MMERYRGDRFSDHQESHRNSQSGNSSSWSSDDHKANFSGDVHHNNFHSNHHFNQTNHHQSVHQSNQNQHYDHHSDHHHMNSEPNDLFGGGGFPSNGGGGYNSNQLMPLPGRKRGFHHSGRGASPDHIDGGSLAKLYVATVPRAATEEDIRRLFEEHGNIVEVVLPKDKKTGQRQGYCFVKYATSEEADRSIRALHNHYTFPGEMASIKVRYADGERERLGTQGTLPEKLYVGCMNKQASKKDIVEIFSPYGLVEDVYIVRDELKQSRGCGFVQLSHRDMAAAAIKALNGIFMMRGCDQPLIVRFAEPKKPRTGEPRSAPCHGDSMGGRMLPNASYPVQQVSTNSQPLALSHRVNHETTAPSVTQQSLPLLQKSPSQLSQLPFQQMQTPQSSQSSQSAVPEMQRHSHLIQPFTQTLEQQQNWQVTRQESPCTNCNPQSIASTSAAPAVPECLQTAVSLECDWSEHTCPDGYKYYYNCVTCESRWKKPKEFTLFEQQLLKQQKFPHSCQQLHSVSLVLSTQQVAETQDMQRQAHLFHQKLHLQQPSLPASELDHVQGQSEAGPVIGPTCA
uniref:Flowering time control protein n=1 Tax=Tapiscia sinensis TaxID=112844 RepID=A0A1Y0B6D5_9ROSI|nr:flowering time control protein [Tapiscia sinensis]